MAYFDETTGAMTVNGITSYPYMTLNCKSCKSFCYSTLWNLSKDVTPKSDNFPIFSYGNLEDSIETLPFTFIPHGPYPSICQLSVMWNTFVVYSNSENNSNIVYQSNVSNVSFHTESNGSIIFVPTSSP